MAPVLTLNDVSVSYEEGGTPVLQGLNLSLEAGEFLALVGGSGVGKSTLLRTVAGLVRPKSGELRIFGQVKPGRRRRAVVFQDGRLLPWRTLRDNIALGLEGMGLSRHERSARIDEVLTLTQLTGLADRWPHQLSGGQVQRGGIARALAVKPDIMLMDEPFSAVDALTRRSLQDEVLRIWQVSGAAVLFVTHDIDEAAFLADRVVVLSGSPAAMTLDHRISIVRPRQRDNSALPGTVTLIQEAL